MRLHSSIYALFAQVCPYWNSKSININFSINFLSWAPARHPVESSCRSCCHMSSRSSHNSYTSWPFRLWFERGLLCRSRAGGAQLRLLTAGSPACLPDWISAFCCEQFSFSLWPLALVGFPLGTTDHRHFRSSNHGSFVLASPQRPQRVELPALSWLPNLLVALPRSSTGFLSTD